MAQSRDAYLKALPSATHFNKRVARYRMKGFHEDPQGSELDAVGTYVLDGETGKPMMGFNKNDAAYVWQYRVVATQTNAAGGAIVLDITPGAGNYMLPINGYFNNSGNNGMYARILDSNNNNMGNIARVAAAAGTNVSVPALGAAAATTNNTSSGLQPIYTVDKLSIYQDGAGVQNDTLTVAIRCYCRSKPTVSVARSTNPGDVTVVETYNELIEA